MTEEDMLEISISDNFGRRTGFNRRKMSSSAFDREEGYERERRVCKDRRIGAADRRSGIDRRSAGKVIFETERGTEKERRSGQDRRVSPPHFIANF